MGTTFLTVSWLIGQVTSIFRCAKMSSGILVRTRGEG